MGKQLSEPNQPTATDIHETMINATLVLLSYKGGLLPLVLGACSSSGPHVQTLLTSWAEISASSS